MKEQKEQSRRFKNTAGEFGVDESGAEFERAFRKIVPPKSPRVAITKKPKRAAQGGA